MLLIFSLLLPVFALLGIGVLAERLRLIPMGGAAALNQLVFNLSMPCLIFHSMAISKPAELAQGGYMAATLVGGLSCFVLAQAIVTRGFRRQNPEGAIIGLLSSFPNAAFLGMPILLALLAGDHDALIAGTITAVLGMPVLLLAIALQEWFRQSGSVSRGRLLAKVIRTMLRNPILIAAVLGTWVCVGEIAVPDGVLTVSSMLGGTSTPCALVALGMVLSVQMTNRVRGASHLWWQVLAHLLKLGVMPLITWLCMTLLGVPPKWMAMGVILAAMPTGSMAYVLGETYDVCPRDASQTILVNTILSLLTIPLLTLLLQQTGSFPAELAGL